MAGGEIIVAVEQPKLPQIEETQAIRDEVEGSNVR